jgi:hypothetical protein
MRSAGHPIFGRLIWTIAVLLLPAWQSLAELDLESDASHADDWVPALGVYSSINIHNADGLAESPQRGLEKEDFLKVFAALEGHLELMSPVFYSGLGDPRVFVRAGAGRSWDSRHLTAEGKPGRPMVNLLPNGGQPPLPGVTGQGTGVRTQFSPYFYTAAAGLAFSIPLEERSLRIKPSIEYRHGSTEIEGLVSNAISIADDGNCPCSLGFLSTNEQKDYDMLGAGLELEVDAQRAGSFMISLFASTQAYRVLSGRKIRASTSGFLDDGVTPLSMRSRVFLDEWRFSAGVGLRLRWLPE